MKSILIPSYLSCDTENAVLTAMVASGSEKEIVLLIPGEMPSEESAAALLRNMRNRLTEDQRNLLDRCREHAQDSGFTLRVLSQHSVSAPLLRNLLLTLETGMIIIPTSFAQCERALSRNCLNWLSKSKLPILRLTESASPDLKKALLLENEAGTLAVSELQQQISARFPVQIVSQARVSDQEESLSKLLQETINQHEIDLVVSTRRPEKKRNLNNNFDIQQTFGLPVLSLHEETVG